MEQGAALWRKLFRIFGFLGHPNMHPKLEIRYPDSISKQRNFRCAIGNTV